MNTNLIKIECLPTAQTQVCAKSAKNLKSSQTIEDAKLNNDGQLNTQNPVQDPKSDNVKIVKTSKSQKSKDADFKKVLDSRLKNAQDETQTQQIAAEPQPQDNEINPERQEKLAANTAEPQTNLSVTQTQQVINLPAEGQKGQVIITAVPQINYDLPIESQKAGQEQNTPSQNINPAASVKIQTPVLNNTQDAANNQQTSQQTNNSIPIINQPVEQIDNPIPAQVPQGVPFGKEMPPNSKISLTVQSQQGQEQAQTLPQSANAVKNDNTQTVANSAKQIGNNNNNNTVKADLPVIPAKPETAENLPVPAQQDNLDRPNTAQTEPANQPVLFQPKTQTVDLPPAITSGNNRAVNDTAPEMTGGQHPGKEDAANDNAKTKHNADTQANISQSSTERPAFVTGLSQFAAGLGKVQIETLSVKTDETQTQTTGLSSQSAAVQSASSVLTQLANDRPIVADKGVSQTNNGSAQGAAASVNEQIFSSLQSSIQQGRQQITVHLNPPELGRVSIKFTEHAGELSGTLETTNTQTRSEIQQALPDILRSLEQSGINIKRIDVTLSDTSRQPAQDFQRNNNAQGQWQQLAQHNFNDGGSRFGQDSFVSYSRFGNASGLSITSQQDINHTSHANNLLNILV